MRRHLLTFALFAAASASAAAERAANPDPKSLDVPAEVATEAKELVGKLGSKSFSEREQATRDLQKLGRLALPAIADALASTASPEVQMRTELLLPAARDDDFRARIDCFLADAGGKFDHQLPGAKAFFAVTGNSDGARNLFRDIALSTNRELLLATDTPDELVKLVNRRKAEILRAGNGGIIVIGGVVQQQGVKQPTAVDLAAVFFAEACLGEKKLGAAAGHQAANLLHQPALRAAIAGGTEKDAVVAILGKWAETREEAATQYYAMSAFKTVCPAIAVRTAVRMIEAKATLATYRGQAIAILAQHGEPDQRTLLLPLLKDETVVTPGIGVGVKRSPIQTRDVALAMLLLVTKQDSADYGLTYRYKNNPGVNDQLKYAYTAYYFDGDDAETKRADALKKWDEWHAAHKDAVKK